MSKLGKVLLIGFLIAVIATASFAGGVAASLIYQRYAGKDGTPPPITELLSTSVPSGNNNSGTTDREKLFAPFWQTWDLVHKEFVDQPVDDVKLMQGAISGMLNSLGDKHTSYMDPDQYRQQNMPLDGEYEGIGAWVDVTGEYVTITSPMPNSPAERAGLRPADTVIAVDGEDMTGIDGNLVLRRILGPAGSEVKLTIRREGTEPFDVTIVREKIVVPSVILEMKEDGIAYLSLTTFGEKTDAELVKALKEMRAQNAKGLILDLRNNGGGYLNTAIDVASQFVAGGKVVMLEDFGDGSRKTYKAKSGGLAVDIPMVVLINKGTASASEIVTGALQDYERAKVIGEVSYGKGSVQNWVPLVDEQGAVRITIARWLTPNERQIHEVGLEPDYLVELTEEDYKNNLDPQYDKALEVLKGLIQ